MKISPFFFFFSFTGGWFKLGSRVHHYMLLVNLSIFNARIVCLVFIFILLIFFINKTKPLSVDLKKLLPYRCDFFSSVLTISCKLEVTSGDWHFVRFRSSILLQILHRQHCMSYIHHIKRHKILGYLPSCDTDLPVLSSCDSLILLPSFFSSSVFHIMVPDSNNHWQNQ